MTYENDHTDAEAARREHDYEMGGMSASELRWHRWTLEAEGLLGVDLDGDEETDCFSLDFAHDAFEAGTSPFDYVSKVRLARIAKGLSSCPACDDTGIASSGPTHDCGDGEGEDQPCEPCSKRAVRPRTYLLSIYELGLGYGGPEEGGWWYDTGDLKTTLRVFADKETAYAAARRLNRWLQRIQKNARPVHSVLYSGGRYAAQVHPDHAPQHYPAVRPHYE